MKRLIQLLPTHHRNDAVGAEALVIERLLCAEGWRVDTYAEFIDPELRGSTRPLDELDGVDARGAVALYHFAVTSVVTQRLIGLDCPKVLRYHNVTPPEFYRPYDPGIAEICEDSLRQVRQLAEHVDLGIGVSEFNRLDLERIGYRATRAVPFLFDPDRYATEPDAATMNKLADRPLVLTVGRVVPNKAPDDFVRVAAAYAAGGYEPARFVFAGKRDALPAYARELDELIESEQLAENQLLFTDEVGQADLVALYRSASLFLSLSRHEGFMVPLLESMLFEVPILALARAAIPETLGGAGCLFDDTDPERVAALVNTLLTDDRLRSDLVAGGRRRLDSLSIERWAFVLRLLLEQL